MSNGLGTFQLLENVGSVCILPFGCSPIISLEFHGLWWGENGLESWAKPSKAVLRRWPLMSSPAFPSRWVVRYHQQPGLLPLWWGRLLLFYSVLQEGTWTRLWVTGWAGAPGISAGALAGSPSFCTIIGAHSMLKKEWSWKSIEASMVAGLRAVILGEVVRKR